MHIVFTVCNRHSLTNALALADSSYRHDPAAVFYLCWVDPLPLLNLPGYVKILNADKINISDWDQMCSLYYDFELVAACRPWFAKELMRLHPACDLLTFMSPSTLLFQSPEALAGPDAALLLTPHLTEPLSSSTILDDKRILNIGMYHSGSWMLRRSPQTEMFLNWWAHRTIDRSRFDLCNGMCLDQLWLNFAPVWVEKTVQLQQPEWHYGLHSVLNRPLILKNGNYTVNGRPLISVDFAGLTFFDPIWSDYGKLVAHHPAFKKLLAEYLTILKGFSAAVPAPTLPGYGIMPKISQSRMLRKGLSGKLRNITKFIDTFSLN